MAKSKFWIGFVAAVKLEKLRRASWLLDGSDWTAIYVVIEAKRRSSCLQVKGSTLISQFFKIPSTVPVPRIGPWTSRSAIKRSTDRANPAAVDYYVQHGRSTGPELNWTGSLAPYFKSLCAFGKLLCDSVNLREILIIFQLNAIDKGKSKGTLNLIALELLKILRILKRKKLKIIFDNF